MPTLPPLLRLCSEDPEIRREAVDSIDLHALAGRYGLRHVLLTDTDADVRSRAAHRLGEAHIRRAVPALLSALDDPMPSVRDRAYRALARLEARGLLPYAARALRTEPMWWVRRAAVRAAAAAAGKEALPLLFDALEDPFWRVRHAAIQALVLLGEDDPDVQAQAKAKGSESPALGAAVTYLQTTWGKNATASATASATATASASASVSASVSAPGISDEDPAVVTARLEGLDANDIPPRSLVAWLGDPHEPLRTLARKRLRERNDLDALHLALRWLDEPRVPHAAAEARALCDRIGGDDVELARRVLAGRLFPGALTWAVQTLVARGVRDALEQARALCKDESPKIRAAAIAGLLRDERSLPLVLEALHDPDEDVRSAALAGWENRPSLPRMVEAWSKALCAFADKARSLREKRAVAEAAALVGDEVLLKKALHDEDVIIRTLATGALSNLGALDDEARALAEAHEDPWIRAAALNQDSALRFAATDPDPWVRRAALDWVVRARDLVPRNEILATALSCSLSEDPWIRARAADLLDPTEAVDLAQLLALSGDTTPMVRVAAASKLESAEDLDAVLQPFLSDPHGQDDAVRIAAYTWLLRRGDDEALEKLAQVLTQNKESADVKKHLEALILVFPDEALERHPILVRSRPIAPPPAVESTAPRPRRMQENKTQLRPLGQTGILVSPLVLSGAHGLTASSFAEAREKGVNAFFWEPRYLEQTRFLRSRRVNRESLVIVGGTYHAGPEALKNDVERALKRLRTEYLDVFLLFWVRSRERLSNADFDALCQLREQGKIRAFGFSTHDRATAKEAIEKNPWPVIMTRHSAAHPGAEETLLPTAIEKGTGILTFTATCYGRLLKPARASASAPASASASAPAPASASASASASAPAPASAPDCYRYSLCQPGVSATLSAPRSHRELLENLKVLENPTLNPDLLAPMRAHGVRVRAESRKFDELIRKGPGGVRDTLQALLDEDP